MRNFCKSIHMDKNSTVGDGRESVRGNADKQLVDQLSHAKGCWKARNST